MLGSDELRLMSPILVVLVAVKRIEAAVSGQRSSTRRTIENRLIVLVAVLAGWLSTYSVMRMDWTMSSGTTDRRVGGQVESW